MAFFKLKLMVEKIGKEILGEKYFDFSRKTTPTIVARKRELAKLMTTIMTAEERDKNLESLFLAEFFELYIKPYYGVLGSRLAKYKIVETIPRATNSGDFIPTGAYYHQNFIKINNSNNDFIGSISTMIHEYQHNLQHKGSYKLLKKYEMDKSKVAEYSNLYPWQLPKYSRLRPIDPHKKLAKQDIVNIIHCYNAITKKNPIFSSVKDLNFAFYASKPIERDARMAENHFMVKFLREMIEFGCPEELLEPYIINYLNLTENDVYSKFLNPYEQFDEAILNLNADLYIKFIREKFESLQKDENRWRASYEFDQKHIDRGTSLQRMDLSYEIHVIEEILNYHHLQTVCSTLTYACGVLNLKEGKVEFDKEKATELFLSFVKNGYEKEASCVKDICQQNNFSVLEQKEIQDIYLNGDVCEEAYDLPYYNKRNCLKSLLEQGKFQFCQRIMQNNTLNCASLEIELNHHHFNYDTRSKYFKENIWGYLKDEEQIYQEQGKSKEYLDYILNDAGVVGSVKRAFEKIKQHQANDTLVFDDLDDFIILLDQLCAEAGVDISQCEEIHFETRQIPNRPKNYPFTNANPIMFEIQKTLYDLYQEAERLAYTEVCKKLNRKPSINEYRYHHHADRAEYRLQSEIYDEYYKARYGEFAYESMAHKREIHNTINQEFIKHSETLREAIEKRKKAGETEEYNN